MKVLLVALIAVLCLSRLIEAGGRSWDEYLNETPTCLSAPPVPVKLDGEVRKPLMLVEPSEGECNMIYWSQNDDFEADEKAGNPKAVLGRKTISYCKEKIEKSMMDDLARVDDKVKGRVDTLVENMIKANGGQGFERILGRSYLPKECIYEGILATIEENGVDLSSIKDYSDFRNKFVPFEEACKEIWNKVQKARDYSVFIRRDKIQAEPTVARWSRNALVCNSLTDNHFPYRSGAFELLEKQKQEAQMVANKGGKRFSILKAFKKSH